MIKSENIFPPGEYYIGDLCYVLSREEWDEVNETLFKDNPNGDSGVYTLSNGKKIAVWPTAWGDGDYQDEDGNEYAVDSGSIGCILTVDQTSSNTLMEYGNVILFNNKFISECFDNVIRFGDVVINTGSDDN